MSFRFNSTSGIATIFASAILLTGCSTLEVTSDYDRDADFSSYKTYTIITKPEDAVQNRANEIIVRRIESAIENELQEAGFTRAAGSADINVAWHGSTKEEHSTTVNNTRYAGAGWGYGYRGWWGPGYGSSTVSHQSWEEGMLIIDLIDSEENQLVWRGVATAVLSENSGTQEYLDKVVGRMISQYPGN